MKLVLVYEWDVEEEDLPSMQEIVHSTVPPIFDGHAFIAIKEKAEEVLAVFAC